eukprot:1889769-Rhodomonas_salina.1
MSALKHDMPSAERTLGFTLGRAHAFPKTAVLPCACDQHAVRQKRRRRRKSEERGGRDEGDGIRGAHA